VRPEDCKPGVRVWYEPSPGIRFLGEVTRLPRLLGTEWVTDVAMPNAAYGIWRRGGQPGENRMSVPAAALTHLYLDDEAAVLRGELAALKKEYAEEMREAQRDCAAAYSEGRWAERGEDR
jgi:hypothetical protein